MSGKSNNNIAALVGVVTNKGKVAGAVIENVTGDKLKQ